MGREAVKDVRATLMETYFGKAEHASEPGTPLSPTMQEVSADRGFVSQYQVMLDSYASRGSVHGRGQEQDRGLEHQRPAGAEKKFEKRPELVYRGLLSLALTRLGSRFSSNPTQRWVNRQQEKDISGCFYATLMQ
jgi:hypothetical protein